MRKRIYHSFHDDLVTSRHQDWRLPGDYNWRCPGKGWQQRLVRTTAKVISVLYCRLGRAITFKNAWRLKAGGPGGFVVYGNHTQPTGDVLIPYYLGKRQTFNVLASPANLGIPVLGPLTTLGGALPTPQTLHQLGLFNRTVVGKLAAGEWVMIYPEEHVWPYYTGIRPFNPGAFHFPVVAQVPAYCLTVTYRKRRWRRPRLVVYLDGPFEADQSLLPKQQQRDLQQRIQAQMTKRAATSNVQYVTYEEG
ncbi:lysophospholipid acyltransferase family protein [Levilactobacillus fuyuanensis]|uniref:Lysophospholipid acyltransferase family protein n=1 Tax=Levilactobacillus fuyuanensis TaxID=2486022 RepID=A0ABW4H4D6_9LACO|nr:acyl-phosphate glycerol 3-phosphate acyltransferase [Levilactobacillus fuyuanensis]